ncbi:MraY family glycosyltransferase [Alkaliphilus peptidifermentans]|uniref:UDP-GlcNAc:undecaprenyl-phosphate GlcNAc-1-phosphate transferase n=1 Tax=Alkaliphilus peptidifermentans DSM 18978 TaxID=1120976 RepID=A0A1G5JH17_9FIRM|nr:MraY family glycosyltransferase [Alkaliphilus peptidifermentans]SCY87577.1 UDP-GlcNAc:undecaprenyl-phosphate GlcNAc-1-phosphate transferase [Alkaliphilus peptidifermentans DSM 18978]
MEKLFMAFFLALMISYILTPYAKKLAYKIGAVDVPKDNRRVHTKPIPRMGGLAIYVAFALTALIMLPINRSFIGILIGATLITIIGIIDDVKQISAKYKLLVQIIAAVIVVYSGVSIKYISVPFLETGISFGQYSGIVTIFWIIGITNAVNLIDGLDGLAAGVSVIASVTLAIVAYTHGQVGVAMLLIILAGGAVGFLPYNFNPAEIFMGDTGSLLIGFLLASVSIEGVIKSATTIAVAIPVLALGVPVFDTAFAIARRLVNKRPIMEADKGHLHHKLLDYGLSQRQTVLTLYFISMVLGGSAVYISDTSKTTAYLVLLTIGLLIVLGALRLGLVEKTSERKANS